MGSRHARLLNAVLVMVLGLVGREAHTGQLHYRPASLEEAAAATQLAVIARRADPPSHSERVSIAPVGSEDPQRYPSFLRVRERWIVTEVLFRRGGAAAEVGQLLLVDAADYQTHLGLHRLYYLEGVAESPIIERYQGSAQSKHSERILLLVPTPDGHEYAISGGQEVPELRTAVLQALESRPGRAGLQLANPPGPSTDGPDDDGGPDKPRGR